jgi:hypothetical protein
MNNSGESLNDRGGWTLNPHLPAVVPPPCQPIAVPLRRRLRFTLPHGRTILLALSFTSIASGTGFLTAALWPWAHHGKAGPAVMALLPSARDDLAGEDTAREDLAHAAARDGRAGDNPARDSLAGDNPARGKEVSNAGDSAGHSAKMTSSAATSSAGIDTDVCRINPPAPQLFVTKPPTVINAGEPAVLGLKVDGAPDGAQLVICGLVANSVFSAGQPVDEKTWTLPASEVTNATIIPPPGFVGPMKLAVALVTTDKSLADRRTLDLEWLPPVPSAPSVKIPRKVDDADLNKQLEQGSRLKATGNFTDARVILTRIAQAGDSRAAFMLAETYDPISLAKRQLLPPESDLELARIWYRKASALGSLEAPGRLERLATW